MATIVSRKCPNCGYSCSTTVYNYRRTLIGTPLMVCDNCVAPMIGSQFSEWIQLTPIRKFFYISNPFIIGCALFLSFFLSFLPLESYREGSFLILRLIVWLVLFLPIAYLSAHMRCNGKSFIGEYTKSAIRIRDPEYRALLSKRVALYDESIPFFRISEKNKAYISTQIAKAMADGKGISLTPHLMSEVY